MPLMDPRELSVDITRSICVLESDKSRIETLIMQTPTSEARNDLTGANIHIAEAIKALQTAFTRLQQ